MAKATVADLGELHGILCEALKDQLQKEELTPAWATVAATFLKQNSISADPDKNEGLQELAKTLRDRKKGKLRTLQDLSAAASDAEDDFREFGL